MIPIPYESFENLEEEKKQSIINAGFMVFSQYGYAKASVEDIVKTAGISKGSLFYYFGSKKNFFIYLYEYSGKQLEQLVDNPGPDGTPSYLAYTDFFERLNAIQILKMKSTSLYPHMSVFMKKLVLDPSPVVKEELAKIIEKYTKERVMTFFQGIDYYKFKEGIDPMMVIQLLTWISEGMINQMQLEAKLKPTDQNTSLDFERIVELYYKYVNMFRNNFYKEEYLMQE